MDAFYKGQVSFPGTIILNQGVNGKCIRVTGVFDTGAAKSYVSDAVGRELNYRKIPAPKLVDLAVENKKAEVVGEVPGAELSIAGCNMPLSHTLGVVKDLKEELVIGMDVMEPYDIKLDIKSGKPYLAKCPPEMRL